MFRQKRKQRFEVATHVDNLTDGMTARDLREHYRFWCIMNKWGGAVKGSNEFLLAVEKKLDKLSKKEGSENKQKNINNAKTLADNLNKLDSKVLKEVVEVGIINPKFKKALTTEKTEHGVKVGNYLIKIRPFKKRYLYDVINLSTNDIISKDIKLYEMAFCLVNYLNDELLYTDKKMVVLHDIYNEYVQYSNTASHYKRMYFEAKKQQEQTKEAKNQLEFEKNRDLALECKSKIIQLFKENS
tara:strand:+ start:109 stop:834 length:726 start_codon:yes stop_codon:yes gene_type:complete